MSSTEESLKVVPLTANQNLNNLNVNSTTTSPADEHVANVKSSDNIEIIEKPHGKSEKSGQLENVKKAEDTEKTVTLTTSSPSSSSFTVINDSEPSTTSTSIKPTSQSSDEYTKSTTQSSESTESAPTIISHTETVLKEKEGRAISFPLTVNANNDTSDEHNANISNIENIPRNGDAPINFVTSTTDRAGKSKFMSDLSDINMDEEQDMLFNSANSGKKKDKFKEHMLNKKKGAEKDHKQETTPTIVCMNNGKVFKVMMSLFKKF